MKRVQVFVAAVVCVFFAPALFAQMGMNFFQKPNIANIFQPTVGYGAEYQRVGSKGSTLVLQMTVVGREMVDGKEGYWLEMGFPDPHSGGMMYSKVLVTKDDFQYHRVIFQMPGSTQPMEMPFNQTMLDRQRMQQELDKWRSVGTDTVTVPAGTFLCDHWTKMNGKGDVWVSTKVSPFSMVKFVNNGETMVLTRVITNATDHIAGTPMKFNPHLMQQMMMQQMKNNNQQ